MFTIKDIARIANVSESTASKALNGRPDVSAETRKRVLEVAKENNFTPSAFGKALRTKTTGNIGLSFCLEPEESLSRNPFFSRILEGIEAEANVQGYNLIVNLTASRAEKSLPKIIREKHIDGLISVCVLWPHLAETIIKSEIPVIFIDPQFDIENGSQVLIDNEHGAFLSTQLLIHKGHRKIAFIANDLDRMSYQQRYLGYCRALKFHNILLDENLVRTSSVETSASVLSALMAEFKPTAIVFANDIKAIENMKELTELGYKVPGDVSVVGFDDIDLGRYTTPELTTVRVYKEEMGSLAVRNLLDIISKKNTKPMTIVVPVKLVERNSVRDIRDIAE